MHERAWFTSYDEGVPQRVDFQQINVVEMLERSATRFPNQRAIVFMNCSLTYGELRDQVHKLAAALAGLGVKKDTRVAIQLPNLPQTIISYYATLLLGGQVVLTNPLYSPREISHQWRDADVRVAITTDFIYEAKLKTLRDQLPTQQFIIASIPEYLRFPLNLLAPIKLKRAKPALIAKVESGPGIHFFKQLIENTTIPAPQVSYGLDHLALLQYTGGTTGVAKGAMLTHRNLSFQVQQDRAWFPSLVEGKEVLLTALPIFHVFGMTVCMNLPVLIGATMVVTPNPRDIPLLIKSIVKHRVTLFPAVPAMFNSINNHSITPTADLSSIKICISGSAPLSVDILERFERITGSKIAEGFGLTETSPVTHVTPIVGKRKIGSIGLPIPDTDAKIVDMEDGTTELPIGKEGELIVSGPQLMKGYWNKPEETAAMIKDGWLYTGDLAVMDDDGFFRIVGRKKDMIVASGYNIYPDEIDEVLMMHDAIIEAATIGVPDAKRGESVKSFVVLKPDTTVSEAELIAHCRENLAAYKIPRQIVFRDELPKSTVLKILRRELRDQETR